MNEDNHKRADIDLFYMICLSRGESFRDRKQTGGCLGLGQERTGATAHGYKDSLWGDENILK